MTTPAPQAPARRRAVVVGRWTLAAAWALLVVFALPADESALSLGLQAAAYLVLGLLLTVALQQHMALRSACAMSVIAACLIATCGEALNSIVFDRPVPETLAPGLLGAIVGASLSYPLVKRARRRAAMKRA